MNQDTELDPKLRIYLFREDACPEIQDLWQSFVHLALKPFCQ